MLRNPTGARTLAQKGGKELGGKELGGKELPLDRSPPIAYMTGFRGPSGTPAHTFVRA